MSTALLCALAVACGGDSGEEAPEAGMEAPSAPTAEAGGMETPSWMQIDEAAQTVTLDIVAGKDNSNNNWNFNGYANGNATITVPEGYQVTLNFSNQDPNMAHSIGVQEKPAGPWSATPQPNPVFDGAISSNPTSMTEATTVGQSETITFTADTAGEYALVCYIPGHATSGMWIDFDVVAGQEVGVTTGM